MRNHACTNTLIILIKSEKAATLARLLLNVETTKTLRVLKIISRINIYTGYIKSNLSVFFTLLISETQKPFKVLNYINCTWAEVVILSLGWYQF